MNGLPTFGKKKIISRRSIMYLKNKNFTLKQGDNASKTQAVTESERK